MKVLIHLCFMISDMEGRRSASVLQRMFNSIMSDCTMAFCCILLRFYFSKGSSVLFQIINKPAYDSDNTVNLTLEQF